MKNPSTEHGFYNTYDKYDKICYDGMQKHYYLRETKGPGAYLNSDFIHTSPTLKASQYSIPKDDRGLLSYRIHKLPGPGKYDSAA